MDRIDKVLLVLPILPGADLLSTLSSLGFGGEEIGILARPILEQYGEYGLVMLTISASIIFLILMKGVIYLKKLVIAELNLKWRRYVLSIPIYWIFMLQGVYVSTVIMNYLVPLTLLPTQAIILKVIVTCTYLAAVSGLTVPQMKKIIHA